MLVELTLRNYRSFLDRFTWSLEPETRLAERDDAVNEANLHHEPGGDLLKVSALYGANASGKSNLLRALTDLRQHVLGSASEAQAGDGFHWRPFRLSTDPEPIELEVVAVRDGMTFRYGVLATPKAVQEEWLYLRAPESAEESLAFYRRGKAYETGPAWPRDGALEARTRPDALHLSVAAQFNHEVAEPILGWFRAIHNVGSATASGFSHTAKLLDDPKAGEAIRALVRKADLGIVDLQARVDPVQSTHAPRPLFTHRFQDEQGTIRREIFEAEDESAGTVKLAAFAGPVIEALHRGSLLVVDEIDARLHTLLTMEVIRLFQDPVSNPHGAQLLFATHDTNLLTRSLLRRDQIWFTEKNRSTGATDLYSLAEVKLPDGRSVRNDRNYERDYLQGRYGAVPFFGNLRALVGLALDDGSS